MKTPIMQGLYVGRYCDRELLSKKVWGNPRKIRFENIELNCLVMQKVI